MNSIVHICPKCGKRIYKEEERKYYESIYGCTVRCYSCNLSLIGVDLSVCAKCDRPSKKNCMTRFFTTIIIE